METDKVSKFNSGILIIQRIDQLWKDTHRHSRNGKYRQWNEDLDRVWLELARTLKSNFDEKQEEYNTIEEEIAKIGEGKFFDEEKGDFSLPTPEERKKRNSLYRALMKKQLFLARIEEESNLGNAYEDEDEGWD